MSFVITKAGMWQTKGLGIKIDEVMEAESRSCGWHRVKTGWGASQTPTIRWELPNASLWTASESPITILKPHTQMFLIQCFWQKLRDLYFWKPPLHPSQILKSVRDTVKWSRWGPWEESQGGIWDSGRPLCRVGEAWEGSRRRGRERAGPFVDETGTPTLRSFYSLLNILPLRSDQVFADFVKNLSLNAK